MMEVKGFIQGDTTIITNPKFEERHLLFMQIYFNVNVRSENNKVILFDKIPMARIELCIKAYIYEFGTW